jgi:AP-1-like factor
VGFADLSQKKGFDNLYSPNNFMNYQTYPMQYPMHSEDLAPLGLIPLELDIEGLYEDHDRRRRKNTSNEKTVSSHVHSVCIWTLDLDK